MEQQLGEPEGEPQLSEHEEIEVVQHKLPDGFFATSEQMFAQIYDKVVIKDIPTDWS